MKRSYAVEQVMGNPMLISKIASYLRYDFLKICRQLSKLWRYEVTKLSRPRTRVCVNEQNIDSMLYASTILGLTLHIRWSSLISLGPRTLLQKYSRYIESLSWFVDSSGILRGDKSGCIVSWDLRDIMFIKVKELYLILTECQTGPGHNFELISSLLNKCPALKSLRLEVLGNSLDFSRFLKEVPKTSLECLQSLHLGKGVKLSLMDFKFITNLTRKLHSFTWEAPWGFEPSNNQIIFRGDWILSLHTLELNSLPPAALPILLNLRRLSIKLVGLSYYNMQMCDQFPYLEDLSLSLGPAYDWTTWVPHDMPLHTGIKSLTWACREELSEDDKRCLQRVITKLPNLKSLDCPTDDKFLQVICRTMPHLKKLKLHGRKCSDSGVTGIPFHDICNIVLESDSRLSKMSAIDKLRAKPCIYDLKELEELTLIHTGVSEMSIPLAISGMTKLRKLYITGITMVGILELLAHPSLLELGVPQPVEKTVSLDDIYILQSTTAHMKIISGWDASYIQP